MMIQRMCLGLKSGQNHMWRLGEIADSVKGTRYEPLLHYHLACAYSQRSGTWDLQDAAQQDKRTEDLKLALDELKTALDAGFKMIGLIKSDPELANLRGEAAFDELMAGK